MDYFGKKKRYQGDVPGGKSRLYFKDSAGDNFIKKINQVELDGNTATSKSFGDYIKILYNKQEGLKVDPVLVYTGPDDNFSEYTLNDIVSGCARYWGTVPKRALDFTNKLLLVLPRPKRILTTAELAKVLEFKSRNNCRIVIFCGSDETISNQILVQLSSKLEFIEYTPALTGFKNISGFIMVDGVKTLFWVPAEVKSFVGVRSAYWSTAELKDFNNFGLSYSGITGISPIPMYLTIGTIPSGWLSSYDHYAYSESMFAVSDPVWTDIRWGSDPSPYPATYFSSGYTQTKAELIDWIEANVSELPMYYLNDNDWVPSKTTFAYGLYRNYSETTRGIFNGFYAAYANEEKIVTIGFYPSWLSKASGFNQDVGQAYKIMLFSLWLLYGKLDLYPDMFNTGNRFTMPLPFTYEIEYDGEWRGGLPIQY